MKIKKKRKAWVRGYDAPRLPADRNDRVVLKQPRTEAFPKDCERSVEGLGLSLVVECSRCSAVSVFHWGQLLSVINGMALHALAKDKDVYCK